MVILIDAEHSKQYLDEFLSLEEARERASLVDGGVEDEGLEKIRDDFSGYFGVLFPLNQSEIDLSEPGQKPEVNKLLDSLWEAKANLGKLATFVREATTYVDLCRLCRTGNSYIYKQLAIHPRAFIARDELDEYCEALKVALNIPVENLPTRPEEKVYLRNVRERYITATCVREVFREVNDCSPERFNELFAEHAMRKKLESQQNLAEAVANLKIKLS